MGKWTATAKQLEQAKGFARVRHFCAVGGSRSTKTSGFIAGILARATKAPGTKHAIFRLRANAARTSIALGTLPKIAGILGCPLIEHRQDGFYEIPDCGSQIWIGGLDDKERVEKILGNEYSTILFNECSQIAYASVLIALTRLAEVHPAIKQRAFYDLNPVGKGHWTNVLFGEKKDPRTRQPLANPQNYGRIFMNPVDNPHLSQEYLAELAGMPERQRKRFYEGLYVDEVDGALWPYEVIEKCRVEKENVPELKRIVVAVDPSGAADAKEGEENDNDEIGIVVAGKGVDDHLYVLADLSLNAGPAKWGRAAINGYITYEADRIVAEKNFGGEMVRYVINSQNKNVPVTLVNASRGKTARAEPVSSLYEKGIVHHVGRLDRLEDQMAAWATNGYSGEGSPDRADALVWAITELGLKIGGGANIIEFYRRENEKNRPPETQDADVQQRPPGKTVEEVMLEEAAARIALADKAALRDQFAAAKAAKKKGRSGRKQLGDTPPPVPAKRRSSFFDQAEAQGYDVEATLHDDAPKQPPLSRPEPNQEVRHIRLGAKA